MFCICDAESHFIIGTSEKIAIFLDSSETKTLLSLLTLAEVEQRKTTILLVKDMRHKISNYLVVQFLSFEGQ